MVKRLATSPHDPLGITVSACKNQSVVVSVQYGPFNPYVPIRSTTIDSIGYPRMSASGESSTTMHRLLHASGSHPIPTPYDPNFGNCVDRSDQIVDRKIAAPTLPTLSRPPTALAPPVVRRASAHRRCSRDWTRSDHVDEEIPFVSNLSALLVQTDEGVLFPVVDRIRRSTAAYRRLPLKCQIPCESFRSQAPRRRQDVAFVRNQLLRLLYSAVALVCIQLLLFTIQTVSQATSVSYANGIVSFNTSVSMLADILTAELFLLPRDVCVQSDVTCSFSLQFERIIRFI
ncbi:thioredoxin family protein [Dorcoceras hygrometricum]|uniref:Thioredoxin family protein n=1 Tax=Dorcoceras hygrometricum TaxID=472368 RepID=A0A2Z7BN30_9LAMI|nr:thioredoxin family protein [Dorcoceras hygrometricum]